VLRTWSATATLATAEAERDAWIARVRQHGPEPIQQALSAFVKWKPAILAFFRFLPPRISNGFVEGKTLARKPGCGRLTARAMFSSCVCVSRGEG